MPTGVQHLAFLSSVPKTLHVCVCCAYISTLYYIRMNLCLGTGHYLWKGGGEGKNKGAICINKLLEGRLLNFFKKMRVGGGGCN